MLYSFFKTKDNHYKIFNNLKNNISDSENNSSIIRKIERYNEFQFIGLLSQAILHFGVKNITLQTLQCFFLYKDYENIFPFVNPDDIDDDQIKRLIEEEVCFNCKHELNYLIEYLLSTREYAKDTHIAKLKVLKEKIIDTLWRDIIIIKSIFSNYSKQPEKLIDKEKLNFITLILKELENFDDNLSANIDLLQEKIDDLSKRNYKYTSCLLDIDHVILKKLYTGLEKYNFIDQDITSVIQFIEVFTLDSKSHKSTVHFLMDNIQFHCFIHAIKEICNKQIEMTTIECAGNITNNNGLINAKSVYASASKALMGAKDSESIRSIVKNSLNS